MERNKDREVTQKREKKGDTTSQSNLVSGYEQLFPLSAPHLCCAITENSSFNHEKKEIGLK